MLQEDVACCLLWVDADTVCGHGQKISCSTISWPSRHEQAGWHCMILTGCDDGAGLRRDSELQHRFDIINVSPCD